MTTLTMLASSKQALRALPAAWLRTHQERGSESFIPGYQGNYSHSSISSVVLDQDKQDFKIPL